MQLLCFTKFMQGMRAEQIGEIACELGVSGLDLALRVGQCVQPSNVASTLPVVMNIWRAFGLNVPLVTLEATTTDPHSIEIEQIFSACSEYGIPQIKLGYWPWQQGSWTGALETYWKGVALIRSDLAAFERLGQKYNLRCLIHTHRENYYGVNASAARHLVNGFDPRYIGIYLDPAHLSVNGEPLALAMDICGEYLHMVAAKNVRFQLVSHYGTEQASIWSQDWCALSEGLVHWPQALKLLKDAGYDGAISLHGAYSNTEELPDIMSKVKCDVAFLQQYLNLSGDEP